MNFYCGRWLVLTAALEGALFCIKIARRQILKLKDNDYDSSRIIRLLSERFRFFVSSKIAGFIILLFLEDSDVIYIS